MTKQIVWVLALAVVLTLEGLSTSALSAQIIGKTEEGSFQGVPLKNYIAYEEGIKGQRPGVLVVSEWWGVNDYVRRRAHMLAELGYVALAVDMYGNGQVATTPDEAKKLSSEVMQNFDVAQGRFLAAMELLKKQPFVDPNRIAAIGYCFGGGVVLNMARQGADLQGVVSFHGGLTPIQSAQPGKVKAKVLVLTGAADNFVPPEQVEAFKREMKAADADSQVISYPGAKHSFTNPEADSLGKKFNMPIAYNAKADKESWAQMKIFLKKGFNE